MLLFSILAVFVLGAAMYLDARAKLPLTASSFMALFLAVGTHSLLLLYLLAQYNDKHSPGFWSGLLVVACVIFDVYLWVKIQFSPCPVRPEGGLRMHILIGGRRLVLYGLYAALMQVFFYTYGLRVLLPLAVPRWVWITDGVLAALGVLLLLANGMLRILCTCRRLNILRRWLVALASVIPVINLFAMWYACRTARLEYDHEIYKAFNRLERADSQICSTKYPLVLVHGVGFRDLKYFNYWGRIPKELIRNGAKVYYGNQEAWGTIAYNAEDIKKKIHEVMEETGCEKVNIIAHSKGGLDSRYMISMLDMKECVASLTTMSTPHGGCRAIDMVCHIPDSIYRPLSKAVDWWFRKTARDKSPDFYTASKQFSTAFSSEFNEKVKNVDGVYYQSYASVMKNMFSDYILTIPYLVVKHTDGENDGLVCVDSAKWGEFRGVLRNKYFRGISHGDMIDLRRDDYRTFDVIEKYVEIVSDLKNRGF